MNDFERRQLQALRQELEQQFHERNTVSIKPASRSEIYSNRGGLGLTVAGLTSVNSSRQPGQIRETQALRKRSIRRSFGRGLTALIHVKLVPKHCVLHL